MTPKKEKKVCKKSIILSKRIFQSSKELFSNRSAQEENKDGKTFVTISRMDVLQRQKLFKPIDDIDPLEIVDTVEEMNIKEEINLNEEDSHSFKVEFEKSSSGENSPKTYSGDNSAKSETNRIKTQKINPKFTNSSKFINCKTKYRKDMPPYNTELSRFSRSGSIVCYFDGCGKTFTKNIHLNNHILVHKGERPFSCESPLCGKSFTRKGELKRHKWVHTKPDRFNCETCGRKFSRADHLKVHKCIQFGGRTRTEDKILICFPCDTCEKKFSHINDLNMHKSNCTQSLVASRIKAEIKNLKSPEAQPEPSSDRIKKSSIEKKDSKYEVKQEVITDIGIEDGNSNYEDISQDDESDTCDLDDIYIKGQSKF